jgi:hypothetical protein
MGKTRETRAARWPVRPQQLWESVDPLAVAWYVPSVPAVLRELYAAVHVGVERLCQCRPLAAGNLDRLGGNAVPPNFTAHRGGLKVWSKSHDIPLVTRLCHVLTVDGESFLDEVSNLFFRPRLHIESALDFDPH